MLMNTTFLGDSFSIKWQSREGAHQVFSGFAGIEISCHIESLSFFFYYNQNSLRLYF